MTDDWHSMTDDGFGNGEVGYRVSTADERESADARGRAVQVAAEIAGMIAEGMLPGFGEVEVDGFGRVRLVVDVAAAVLITEAFAREPGAAPGAGT